MITEGMREYYSHEPDGLSEVDLSRWYEGRDFFERGERVHQEAREARRLERSFYGYLANRINEKKWGKWGSPWPAVFWVVEVSLGSTLGAWLALRTLRAGAPRSTGELPHSNPDHELQGGRG
jgi:hypothetical protein